MRKLIAVTLIWLLIFTPFVSTVFAQQPGLKPDKPEGTYIQGLMEGELSASMNISGGWWFVGGIGSGFFFNILGTVAIAGISQMYLVEPPSQEIMRIQSRSQEFQIGFRQGYCKKAKSKKLWYSVGGGLLGFGLMIIMLKNWADR